MKNLNNYIFEKLTINKDTEVKLDIKDINKQYKAGDICLEINYLKYDENDLPKIFVDVIKLIKVGKVNIIFKPLTKFYDDWGETELSLKNNDYRKSDNFRYTNTSGRGGSVMIIPMDKSLNIFNKIRNDKSLNFYKLLFTDYDENEEVKIYKRKFDTNGYSDGFEEMDEKSYDLIENKLKEGK